ncbi:DSD1 family PLP-dependent enzyme [Brucella sp. H1_1004]|uniref:DSD1 family PLP-dependent enzyme n=1 Tax=Brucella sp. H1_1004 TaxID=3110109 RepID=UPI0039B49C10
MLTLNTDAKVSDAPATTTLNQLPTPSLVLDALKVDRNLKRLKDRAEQLGVTLRPHLKTAKSIEIARKAMPAPSGPATVSTLKEARLFAEGGVKDIVYAVGITPAKLEEVVALSRDNTVITVILDNMDQARAVAEASRKAGFPIPALIEVDCDGHRSGVLPEDSDTLIAIGRALVDGGAALRGVITHAGESYSARSAEALEQAAEVERRAVVNAAAILRSEGLPCPIVSVGSTPTAHFAKDLTGVTELRAGVYMFFDLVMRGIGVCETDDIALSVLTTVIGHQKEKNWLLVDAGWMAMSRDRGTAKQPVDCGYGLVCDLEGNLIPDLVLIDANQEHGIISIRPGSDAKLPDLKLGDRLRILPNHACATGAQHDKYYVVEGRSEEVTAIIPRFSGW